MSRKYDISKFSALFFWQSLQLHIIWALLVELIGALEKVPVLSRHLDLRKAAVYRYLVYKSIINITNYYIKYRAINTYQ